MIVYNTSMESDVEKILLKKYKAKCRNSLVRRDKLGNAIEMRLTFDEYKSLWLEAGVLPSRTYCLSRVNDIGHYEVGNVYVNHSLKNSSEASVNNYSDYEQRITEYCIKTGYRRRIVKSLIKRGKLKL